MQIDAKIIFIKPFTLPNFIENFEMLKKEFNFLSSSNDYSKYYKSLESGIAGKKESLIEVPNLGYLMPLPKKHTLHSYWKSIRLPIKNQEKKGSAPNEPFLLLPLKINVTNIAWVRANHKDFYTNLYTYLFPFGSCCVNMEVSITEYNFDELSDLIKNLKERSILENGKYFENYSKDIAKLINKELFGEDYLGVKSFATHTFIFIEHSSEYLDTTFDRHEYGIVAAMEGKSIQDISNRKKKEIDDKIFSWGLKKIRPLEILLFRPESTFIYPSPRWYYDNQQRNQVIAQRKLHCMLSNYHSFFNVISAVNRFLIDSFLEKKDRLPNNRLLEIVKCFNTAFPRKPSDNKIYFENIFELIAEKIGLTKSLQRLRESA